MTVTSAKDSSEPAQPTKAAIATQIMARREVFSEDLNHSQNYDGVRVINPRRVLPGLRPVSLGNHIDSAQAKERGGGEEVLVVRVSTSAEPGSRQYNLPK